MQPIANLPVQYYVYVVIFVCTDVTSPTDTGSSSGDSVLMRTVSFDRSTYNVNEDDGPAQPVLVLSDPSSTNITVKVSTNDKSALGQYECNI